MAKKTPGGRPVKHVGFKGAMKGPESEGYSPSTAAKIIAASARKASPQAKDANPRLKRVKGK